MSLKKYEWQVYVQKVSQEDVGDESKHLGFEFFARPPLRGKSSVEL